MNVEKGHGYEAQQNSLLHVRFVRFLGRDHAQNTIGFDVFSIEQLTNS